MEYYNYTFRKKDVNDEEITYVGTGTTQENEYSEKTEIYFKIKKVNGEYRISEMDLLRMNKENVSQDDKNNIEGNITQLEDNKALIIEECVGKWNSEYAVDLQGEKVDLGDLLGSGHANYGSKLILNEDGTFVNEIQPIQSNEVSNTGTWEYKEKVKFLETTGAGIILKYTDGREETLQIWSSGEADTILLYQYNEENEIHLTK